MDKVKCMIIVGLLTANDILHYGEKLVFNDGRREQKAGDCDEVRDVRGKMNFFNLNDALEAVNLGLLEVGIELCSCPFTVPYLHQEPRKIMNLRN